MMISAVLALVMAATPNTRSWECVPSVVKSDASESFRLVVATDATTASVTLQASIFLNPTSTCILRDDGFCGDAVAGDHVYTSPVFTPALPAAYLPLLANFRRDPTSPAGIGYLRLGTATITRTDGTTSTFQPEVGLILPAQASVPRATYSRRLQATTHLLNIQHSTAAQQTLRGLTTDIQALTQEVYSGMSDAADFLVFICPKKVELVPDAPPNSRAGLFQPVKVDFDGTGRARMDNSAAYGSAGRLHGLVFLDTGLRGLYSANLVHELTHLWSPLMYQPILETDLEHYSGRINTASIEGGFQWSQSGADSLLVASRGTGQILKFDAATGTYSKVLSDLSTIMPSPGGMFLAPGGNLYVSTSSGSTVAAVDPVSGQLVRQFGSSAELTEPRGMALGPAGSLLVASNGTNQILKYSISTGAYLGVFASGSGLSAPLGIIRAPNGNLLVASGTGNQILEYDGNTGAFVRVAATGSPMNQPFGLAFGPSGDLFVASNKSDQILEYAWPAGTLVRVFAQGCTLSKPTWISFRSDGHLLASNSATDDVIDFDQNGGCANATFAGSPLKQPRGLAIQDGNAESAVNCAEGRNGGHRAAPIDLYAMGLLSAAGVPDLLLADNPGPWPQQSCGQSLTCSWMVPFSQVSAALGPRSTPTSTNFRLAFIAETDGRLLNATEMAFYHILAEYVERQVDLNQPDPYVGFNWVPLTRYFQTGSTWASRLQMQCDFNGDGAIDSNDMVLLRACMSGSGTPYASGCASFDLDGDGDVDQSDFGRLQTRLTGPAQ